MFERGGPRFVVSTEYVSADACASVIGIGDVS